MLTFGKNGWGGEHLFKTGVQWGRMYYESSYAVQGDHYVEYNSGVPTQVRQFNTPITQQNIAKVTGFFLQDAWSVNRLTMNIGGRWDRYVGTLPDQERPGGRFIGPASFPGREVLDQSRGVFRLGLVRPAEAGARPSRPATALRLQVGIDRVTAVNPL